METEIIVGDTVSPVIEIEYRMKIPVFEKRDKGIFVLPLKEVASRYIRPLCT